MLRPVWRFENRLNPIVVFLAFRVILQPFPLRSCQCHSLYYSLGGCVGRFSFRDFTHPTLQFDLSFHKSDRLFDGGRVKGYI